MKRILKPMMGLSLVCMLSACSQSSNEAPGEETSPKKSSETIEPYRDKVKSSAVASYTESVGDGLNDWQFSAKLFETKERFRYLLDMQYQEITASDTISFPNFGLEPDPKIQKGENKKECIIGFLDREGTFREYLKVFIDEDEQLRLKTLKHYSVVEKQ